MTVNSAYAERERERRGGSKHRIPAKRTQCIHEILAQSIHPYRTAAFVITFLRMKCIAKGTAGSFIRFLFLDALGLESLGFQGDVRFDLGREIGQRASSGKHLT